MSAPPRTPPSPVPPPPRQPPRHRLARLVGAAVVGLLAVLVLLPDLLFGADRHSPFAQLVAFRPWLLVAGAGLLVALLLLTVIRRRAWPFPVVLAAVLAVGAGMVVPRMIADPPPPEGRTMTVLAFNTYVGRADVDALARLIEQERPDLVSLSEAGGRYRDRLAPLVEPLGYQVVSSTDSSRSDVTGMSVVVADGLGAVDIEVADESMTFTPLQVTGGELGSLRFVAFHAVAPVRRSMDDWAADLDGVAQWCGGPDPVIVAGDFNASLDHSALREGMTGCSDAAAQRGQGLVATWGPTPRTVGLGPQIDHVLASDPIAARDFSAHAVPGSDHRAVLTTLVLPD